MAIKIDFEKFDKKGIQPIVKALEKAGSSTVSEVEATNKPKREMGFQTKMASITFESGQKLVLKIKSTGDIFQVRLNGKVLPIKNADDLDKGIAEVAEIIKKNEATYLKQKERRKKIRVPQVKSVNTSVKAQIETLQTALAATADANAGLVDQKTVLETTLQAKEADVTRLESELKAETDITAELTAELKTLREAA